MIKLKEEEFIPKVYKDNVIPVCFSANNSYVSQTAVMIKSIIENSSEEFNYDFIILSTDIDTQNEQNVFALSDDRKNISIRIFDISAMIENVKFFTDSVYTPTTYSKEAYFRLFIPFAMPDYEKVIYFDGDMTAAKDISPLISLDIGNYMAAATRDYCGIAACYDSGSDRKEYRESIGIKELDNYFISSMVVLNVRMFNETYTLDYVKNLISSRKWRQHDQDILNVLCQDALLIVDPKWSYFEEFEYSLKYLTDDLKIELLSAQKDPCVVHYAGQNKAWVDDKSPMTYYFWKYASMTPYFDTFFERINSGVAYKYHICKDILNSPIHYFYESDDIGLVSRSRLLGKIGSLKVCIEFLNIKNGTVKIDGFFETIDEIGTLRLFAKLNGQGLITYNSESYRESGNFSSVKKTRNFSITFALDRSLEKNSLEFGLTYDDVHFINPQWISVEQFAPINEHEDSFYSASDYILTKRYGKILEFEKHSRKKVFAYNKKVCKYLKSKKNPYFSKIAKVRWLYYFSKPFMRNKNIWLISDTADSVDETTVKFAEFLKSTGKIQPYFVVSSECENFEELKKHANVVPFKSRQHKFLFMFARVVLSSEYHYNLFLPAFDRANEIRDTIANKKFVYWHKNGEDLSYNVKAWHNIYKFILEDKETYDFMLEYDNGYGKENLLLIDKSDSQKEIFGQIMKAIEEEK